jgi:hypothetical protein
MPTSTGPNLSGEENLVFGYDTNNFPYGWTLTQLSPNPEFNPSGTKPTGHSCYTSGYYLGQFTQSYMTGGTFRFIGGDLSNYYVSQPGLRSWNGGALGSTGGNWITYDILPTTFNSSEEYIVELKVRFVYVSRTGNGSTNPVIYLGRAYNSFKTIEYNQIGKTYKTIRYRFNGASGTDYGANNRYLTFGCSSADAMVEMEYLRVYRVEKSNGLIDSVGSSTIDLTNTSFNNNGNVSFDGTNDYIIVPHNNNQSFTGDFTIEAVIYPTANTANCIIQKGSGNDYYQEYWLLQDMRGSNSYINFIMGQQGNASANYITTGNISVLNTYHHIIATVAGNTATVYVNGEQESTGTITNRIQITSDIRIGWRVDGFAATTGEIPLVKLYNRSFSSSEVINNYNNIKRKYGI